MEGSFKKDGKASTCLCFKEKKQNVFCVIRWRQSSKSTFCVAILTANTEPSRPKLAFKEKQIVKEYNVKLRSWNDVAVKEEITHASVLFLNK